MPRDNAVRSSAKPFRLWVCADTERVPHGVILRPSDARDSCDWATPTAQMGHAGDPVVLAADTVIHKSRLNVREGCIRIDRAMHLPSFLGFATS